MPYTNQLVLQKLQSYIEKDIKPNRVKPIKIYDRASTITPEYVGFSFNIHNGIKFIHITVYPNMVGQKIGQFAFTRKLAVFKPNAQKTKAKK